LQWLPDGSLQLTFTAGGVFEITRWVLGWGDAVEVVKPAKLRAAIGKNLQRAAATYTCITPECEPPAD
jgi:predicted DNA-binding transcriptional regulator YafY